MPEGLWFVFWLLRNSRDKFNQITSPPPTDPRSAAYAAHKCVQEEGGIGGVGWGERRGICGAHVCARLCTACVRSAQGPVMHTS